MTQVAAVREAPHPQGKITLVWEGAVVQRGTFEDGGTEMRLLRWVVSCGGTCKPSLQAGSYSVSGTLRSSRGHVGCVVSGCGLLFGGSIGAGGGRVELGEVSEGERGRERQGVSRQPHSRSPRWSPNSHTQQRGQQEEAVEGDSMRGARGQRCLPLQLPSRARAFEGVDGCTKHEDEEKERGRRRGSESETQAPTPLVLSARLRARSSVS